MINHTDPLSTIDHDTLDDVTGACAPACATAKPAAAPAQAGCHGASCQGGGWPFAFFQQQQQQGTQQFDFRGWPSSFMRRFRY